METLKDKFDRFHNDNPHVYALYKRFASQCIDAGMKVLSIALLTERVRWETSIVTRANDNFKINNNHKAFYARMLNDEPQFKGKFPTRIQRAV